MRRREFLQSVGAAICSGALTSSLSAEEAGSGQSGSAPSGTSILPLGGERYLFIDDLLTFSAVNVTLQVHQPIVRDAVVQAAGHDFDGYHSVIDDGTQKIYYENSDHNVRLATYDEVNNRWNIDAVVFQATQGSAFFDPDDITDRRYKFISRTSPSSAGIAMRTSRDGETWSLPTQILARDINSQAVMYRDRYLNRYIAHLPGWKDGKRTVFRNVNISSHPLDWSSQQFPVVLSTDDSSDPSNTDVHAGQVTLYPHAYKVYLAFPTFYYHFDAERAHLIRTTTPPQPTLDVGVGEVQLCVSRDGIRWTRYSRAPYLKPGWHSRTYVGWPFMLQGMVFRGNKIHQYAHMQFSGHNGINLVGESERQYPGITRIEQQRDRFVAAQFKYEGTGGTLMTKPFTFTGDRLVLNFDSGAMGEGKVAIMGTGSSVNPLFGYSEDDCFILNGDHFNKIVEWKKRVGGVPERDRAGNFVPSSVIPAAGTVIRLRFSMRGTSLYGFQFVP